MLCSQRHYCTNYCHHSFDEILCRHGAPRVILSDKGQNFMSHLVRHLCNLMGTTKVNTTSYHPQCDGLVERFNKTLCNILSMYVSSNQQDWDLFLPAALCAYHCSPCTESSTFSLFILLYSREPRLPADISLLQVNQVSSSVQVHLDAIIKKLRVAHDIARRSIKSHQKKMKE